MVRTRRWAVRIAAVAAAVTLALVTTAAGASAVAGTGADPTRSKFHINANADPVPLVSPDEERNSLLSLVEAGASFKSTAKAWTQTGVGASINQSGSNLVVAAVHNSLDGDGAVVSTVTLNGNNGTDTATRYQENGVQKFQETFTLGAPDANGLIPYNGTGKCTGPGTGAHTHEKCSYTFTGTLNPATNVVNFNITGVTTR